MHELEAGTELGHLSQEAQIILDGSGLVQVLTRVSRAGKTDQVWETWRRKARRRHFWGAD